GIESIDAFFSQLMPQAFASVLIPLIIGLVALVIDPLSGLILLLTTPVLLVFMYLIGHMAATHTKKQWNQLSRMSAHFLDVLQGLTTLKLFGRSQAQRETIGRISDLFRATTMDVLRVAFLSSLALEIGATISTAMVAVEIGLRLLYNQLAFAPAFFVLLLAPDFYLPLRTLGAKFHASMSGSASAQRIYEIMGTPIPGAEQSSVLPSAKTSKSIDFRNVTYTYHDGNGDEHPALHNVSFSIERGQKVALVGPSGAGKSTIASLLLRFSEPQAGEIVIDGTPLAAIQPRVWREQIAWIPQRPSLFNVSIAENIRMGRAGATMDEIIAAARQAQLHEFIEALPSGYETIVGERGARLSGGQAQRLAIARAMLKDAPILLLDEATAHLDSVNEQAVLDALHTLMQGRIALIIAHHLHTVRTADHIILLAGGQIIATGTHEQLLAHSRAYCDLVGASERNLTI
ncbi:MAG TPA: thiol reductant ABC exporter subunit CydD, partial [Ktedonobacteraceae bacterium]|nr:thiol reductant ABC exporter subunit CydD [Ktedonobacteraceae bacterium]